MYGQLVAFAKLFTVLVASAGRFILLALSDASIESLALLLSPLTGALGADIGLVTVVYRYIKLGATKVAGFLHGLPPESEGNDGAGSDTQIAVILQQIILIQNVPLKLLHSFVPLLLVNIPYSDTVHAATTANDLGFLLRRQAIGQIAFMGNNQKGGN